MNAVDIARESFRLPPERRRAYVFETLRLLTGRTPDAALVTAALRDAQDQIAAALGIPAAVLNRPDWAAPQGRRRL